VEQQPSFPGGEAELYKYLANNIQYPDVAKNNNITGRVYLTFVVEKDGTIANAKILRDIGGGCGAEALRVVNSMPKWTPGKQRGQAVRVQFNLPVSFDLQ
jgi:protein TonB